ncbi:MAG: ABC transporter ATP-binding protein [Chloroflexota bacterium]
MTVALKTERLTKRFGRSLAVAGVELEVEQGEIFGLVGPNGAGKTTTLKMLATLLVPSAGDAEVGGHSIRKAPDAVRNVIGYMPDTFGVYDDMRVWEYLDFFGRCYGLPASRRRQMIGDLLELVDLADKREAYVQELSRGMQQRLCLAHALVHDPQVLLLDEPASGLDPRARVELRELLRELRSLGKTIIISSHILPELEELCTSVAIIDKGRVLASGRVDEIAERFRIGGVYRATVVGDDDQIEAAEQHFAASPNIATVMRRPGGELEFALRGDVDAAAAVLTAAVRAGVRLSSFAPAASDLEELFLQITDAGATPASASAKDNGSTGTTEAMT